MELCNNGIANDNDNRHRNINKNGNIGEISLPNPHLAKLSHDVLYHLGIDTATYNLPAMFGDLQFVCMGGTKHRMKEFAQYMQNILKIENTKLVNLTKHSHRYAMYKVGPVLSVNHGIGIPSMTVVLQEIMKLLRYARAKDPIIIRLGTSGGLKVTPGTVVVSSWGMNGMLEKTYNLPILGEMRKLPSIFDKSLGEDIMSVADSNDGFDTIIGGTMGADDFYRGQARCDGPICDYTEEDKMNFLKKLSDLGVRNIEMEAPALAALTNEAGFRSADVCVTLIDRLHGDQITTSKETLLQWQQRPMLILGRYIEKII